MSLMTLQHNLTFTMATLHVSSRNPFRSPTISPNSTGTFPPVSPPPLPPRPRSPSTSDSAADSTSLSDELPPAYTPAPDTRQGESTIEYGPRRPFQAPPPHPSPTVIHHSPFIRPTQLQTGQLPTLWSRLTGLAPMPTGSSGWSSISNPQQLQPNHTASQSTSHLQVPRRPSPAPSSPASEFARDFYATGAGAGESEQMYDPPPGPPPSSPSLSASLPQPTSVPKSGHPLLRDGKLLVYPNGFRCEKCEFTSFRLINASGFADVLLFVNQCTRFFCFSRVLGALRATL